MLVSSQRAASSYRYGQRYVVRGQCDGSPRPLPVTTGDAAQRLADGWMLGFRRILAIRCAQGDGSDVETDRQPDLEASGTELPIPSPCPAPHRVRL